MGDTRFTVTYGENVTRHLTVAGWRGRMPTPLEMATARNQLISPKQYARWFRKQNRG